MSELWLVTSIGHCATKWLAQALDAQPGIKAHHELKTAVAGMPWHKALKYEQRNGAASAKYREYWDRLDADLQENQIVVDVNSWVPTALQDVTQHRDVDRVIYIVRHGVSQLHSLWNHSDAWRKAPLNSHHLTDYITAFTGIEDVSEMDRWERMCHLWAGNAYYAHECDETVSFEQLTQSPIGLQKIIPSIGDTETLALRQNDVNRKVTGNRRPPDIWAKWTPEMRETFTAVCGDAMELMGYKVPS